MSESFGSEGGLDRVFDDAYWGEVYPEPARLRESFVSSRHKEAARHLLSTTVHKIVAGEIEGTVFTEGRFKATDPDLSRKSLVNRPGAILITDRERVRSLSSFSRRERRHSWLPGYGDPENQGASTRHLLQLRREVGDNGVAYGRGRVVYMDDNRVYERVVGITMLLPTWRGAATPRDLSYCRLPTSDSDRKAAMLLGHSTDLTHAVHIGETYRYSQRDMLSRRDFGLNRLTSLEVCVPGEPVEALAWGFNWATDRLAPGSAG